MTPTQLRAENRRLRELLMEVLRKIENDKPMFLIQNISNLIKSQTVDRNDWRKP